MTEEQYLLVKIAEEAGEVVQAALKCAHLGIDNKEFEWARTNSQTLKQELNDLFAVVEMLEGSSDCDLGLDSSLINAKIEKVGHWMKYSQVLGLVKDE